MKKPAGVSQIPRSSLTTEEAREVFEDLSRKATRRRSRRRVQRLLLAAGVLIGSALAVWGLFGLFETEGRQPTGPAPASISTPQPSGSPIILPPEGRTQFSPAPSGTQSALSADQAVSRYETQNSAFHLPRDATAQLGYYTAAVGDGSYRFHDRLAWGFSWPGCAPAPTFPSAHPSNASSSSGCLTWLFLDANTGKELEGITPVQ